MSKVIQIFVLAVGLLVAGCGSVGIAPPTPTPQPLTIVAEQVTPLDMNVVITNNTSAPIALGGWTMQVTPIISPTLVQPAPFPDSFAIQPGATLRVHTAGGTNGDTTLFFDNGGVVPPEAWQQGVKVEMRNPQNDEAITRYIYTYSYNPQ